jgi:hypothetical protein
MRQKPWLIKIMTLSLVLVPVTAAGLVYIAKTQHHVHLTTAIVMDLWVLSAASLVAAFGVWRVRPWGFVLFFIFVLGILGFDIHHIVKNPNTLNVWDLVDVSLAALGIIFILQKHISAPYFNPKIRWWERPDRFRVEMQATLLVGGQNVSSQILDVSSTGCFLDTEALLTPGDIVSMGLTFKEYKFESPVKVIRNSSQPKGVGLMYVDSTPENKREIKRIIRDLKKNLKAKRNLPLEATA